MKFIHISDLHLGKRLNGYWLIDEQRDILRKITGMVADTRPDAVLIAGDIYDRSIPSEEAVQLFDGFLNSLSELGMQTFLISGNHDSAERLSFASRLMEKSGIHIAPVYNGRIRPFVLQDAYGPVFLWLLPFVKPLHVRAAWPGEEAVSFTDALKTAIAHMEVDPSQRNVLAAHQFVSGAARSDSEETVVGGLDEVSAEVFAPFDYVALGHLHRPQNVTAPAAQPLIRYSGSPLAYSFSEAEQEKSVTLVEIGEKTAEKAPAAGQKEAKETPADQAFCTADQAHAAPKAEVKLTALPLVPLRPLRRLRGTFAELTLPEHYREGNVKEAYLHITLTDEQDIPDAFGRLKAVYPYLMLLEYDNTRTRTAASVEGVDNAPEKSPMELFEELYMLQNGAPLTAQQRAYLTEKIEALKEVAE